MNNGLTHLCVCVCVYRCGVTPHVSDMTRLSLTSGDLNVPLPSEVKALGTEADRVLTLEEMAMRTLHVAYSRNRKGETDIHLLLSLAQIQETSSVQMVVMFSSTVAS